ncbi:Uncharacterized protein FWK35_00002184 [Aphis craccivora]|uniref:Uncharacterized protein n=1 Tax=Aphis craccivora TaxID=307492 RepID=A0A6G0Z7V0_APHCR|nr:Uncharacterized protein FWK35_00002184 [Aphis craccivora]
MPPDANQSLFSISLHENQPQSKMGAEKVSMNIVVVGQVQSAKAVKIVAKAAPATSQLMVKLLIQHVIHTSQIQKCHRPNNTFI